MITIETTSVLVVSDFFDREVEIIVGGFRPKKI